jgi:hypothetical protein
MGKYYIKPKDLDGYDYAEVTAEQYAAYNSLQYDKKIEEEVIDDKEQNQEQTEQPQEKEVLSQDENK